MFQITVSGFIVSRSLNFRALILKTRRLQKTRGAAPGGWAYFMLNVTSASAKVIPCFTSSNVLPFYVTAETGSLECPGFAALGTLLKISLCSLALVDW